MVGYDVYVHVERHWFEKGYTIPLALSPIFLSAASLRSGIHRIFICDGEEGMGIGAPPDILLMISRMLQISVILLELYGSYCDDSDREERSITMKPKLCVYNGKQRA